MGQYIYFKPDISLHNHEYYRTREEVLSEIEDNERQINDCRMRLFGLVCGDIRSLLVTKDCEGCEMDPIEVAQRRVDELFDEDYYSGSMRALIEHNVVLRQLYDNWDSRDASEFEYDTVTKPSTPPAEDRDNQDPLSSC